MSVSSSATLDVDVNGVVVPAHDEALARDSSKPNDTMHTQNGEAKLPSNNVMTSDTECMYNVPNNASICELCCVDGIKQKGTSVPFLHKAELGGGGDSGKVELVGVFDDGGMVNALDADAYEMFKNKLNTLQKLH